MKMTAETARKAATLLTDRDKLDHFSKQVKADRHYTPMMKLSPRQVNYFGAVPSDIEVLTLTIDEAETLIGRRIAEIDTELCVLGIER